MPRRTRGDSLESIEAPLISSFGEAMRIATRRSRGIAEISHDPAALVTRRTETPSENELTPFSTTAEHPIEDMGSLISEVSGFKELTERYPEDVLSALKNQSIVKLGTFQATDSEVLAAFGNEDMLTRGCETLREDVWEENWRQRIRSRCKGSLSHISVGWEEMVTLGAYAVNLRNVATRDDGALLQMLLERYSSGAASTKVWNFPAVRAVINYHWQHWARRYRIAESIAFLCWMCSFSIYLCLYIEDEDDELFSRGDRSAQSYAAYILNFVIFCFMTPFAFIEGWTLVKQKDRWLQVWNILDLCTIILQIVIFVCHLLSTDLASVWFSTLLGTQCVFLFVRLQSFGRVLGTGAALTEIFASVMYDARFLIMYILLTGISASLCLGAIFREETSPNATAEGPDEAPAPVANGPMDRAAGDEELTNRTDLNDFGSIRNSLITTVFIMFGGFKTSYVFDADDPWIKFIFFFGLQVLMSITVLNLLIAVMTESYAKFAKTQHLRFNRGRARVIDELLVLNVPKLFAHEMLPYIHFLVVEKTKTDVKRPSAVPSVATVPEGNEELYRRMEQVSSKLDVLLASYGAIPLPPET